MGFDLDNPDDLKRDFPDIDIEEVGLFSLFNFEKSCCTYIDAVGLRLEEGSQRFAGFLSPRNRSLSIALDRTNLKKVLELAEAKDSSEKIFLNY